ncbi:MAG: hypothetical protein ACOYVD_06770 [Bacillota bacterium]
MRKRMRSEEFFYGKTKKDTEFGAELTNNTRDMIKKESADVSKFANNPRPKYEIYPGE